YIQGAADGAELTAASDIFALGLIYAEYLTGALPPFDAAFHEAAIAVLNGTRLVLPPASAPAPIAELVGKMLLADAAARPTIEQVHATLMGWRSGAPTTAAPLRLPPPAPGRTGTSSSPRPTRSSSLRGRGLRLADGAHRAPTGTTRPRPLSDSTATPVIAEPPLPTAIGGRDTPAPSVVPLGTIDSSPGGFGRLVGKLLSKLEERRSR
ncbi:MAG: hypothetical protein ABWZ98_02430, partial [Nakamurella sp.]